MKQIQTKISSIFNQDKTHNYIHKKSGNETNKRALTVTALAVAMLSLSPIFSEIALASTTTSGASDVMAGAYTQLNGIIKGSITKILAVVSLTFGLIGCVLRFNAVALASTFGVAIAAGAGPKAIETLVGAVF